MSQCRLNHHGVNSRDTRLVHLSACSSRNRITEVRGESLAVHGGDESDNRATTAESKPFDNVYHGKHNGQQLAVGLGSARTTKATIPFPRGRLRGCGDTAGKKRPSSARACPPWREGQAGRWHGPCPDAPKEATGGIPAVSARPTGCTVQADTASERTPNTPHPSRGRRIAHEPGIASPDPVRQARRCQRGLTERPDAPRPNPRARARGGCQSVTSYFISSHPDSSYIILSSRNYRRGRPSVKGRTEIEEE
jgi:hypothetical protein